MRARPGIGRQLGQTGLVVVLVVLMSSPAAAEVDVYGRLNITLQNSDEAAAEQVELQSNSSRVGVKGKEALKATSRSSTSSNGGSILTANRATTTSPRATSSSAWKVASAASRSGATTRH